MTEKNFLDRLTSAIKKQLDAKDTDYVTVTVSFLIGEKTDVLEAEATIMARIDLEDLPCKSARIQMSGWKK